MHEDQQSTVASKSKGCDSGKWIEVVIDHEDGHRTVTNVLMFSEEWLQAFYNPNQKE